MADTELQQLIIYVGTTAQINAAIQAGTITENDLAISTDAPDFQEKLTQVQMDAVNSGITTQLVSLYSGHVADTTIHVTSQNKTTWNNKQDAINDLSTIRDGAALGATSLQPSDVINNTTSTTINKPLSANMGKSLQDQVDNLKARGRFLALWNCATGLAESNPPSGTYTYQSGDYFIVGTVASAGGTNYKPNGSTYTTGVSSTTVETQAVDTDDVYYYDGSVWRLQVNTQKEVGFVNIAGSPYDNTNLASSLNDKQDNLPSQSGNNGKFLTTNGSDMSWATVDALPSQTGQSGKYLTTNGVSASWGTIDFSNFVTLNTSQKIQAAKAIFGTDVAFGSDTTQKNLLAVISNDNSTAGNWIGRLTVGAKNKTFIMGTYGSICVLGAHSWTNAQQGTGAAWEPVYINPDGDKAVYIGGSPINGKQALMVIQNVNANTTGTVKINRSTNLSNNFKDVACWGDNVSKFTNDAGYGTGTVKSVNSTSPDSNGNVSLNVGTFYWGE